MASKKLVGIVVALIAAIFSIGGIVALVRYMRAPAPASPSEQVAVRAKYTKGSASFLYPAQWVKNDIPTSPGFISVQLLDQENIIVFVASSGEKESDPAVDGVVRRDEAITIGGVVGKDRVWENEKTQAVVFRADHIAFGGRSYRFEMFGQLSRKVLMEKYWQDIMSSVQFAEAQKESISAVPATTTLAQ